MKIKSITIGGFKNLKKTKIEFQNMVSIVSPNNYGKSNLLEAIDFGIEFISASEKDRKMMMKWVKGIPINKALATEDYYFEIEFVNNTNDDYNYVKYGYSFSWYRDNGTGQKITDEWIEARPNESVRYTSYLKRNEGAYRKEKNTQSFRKIKFDSTQLAVDALSIMNDLPIHSTIKAIKNIDYRVCSSLDLNDRFQSLPTEYILDNNEDDYISFDDKDVSRALYKLSQIDPEKYELFLEAVYTLFPEFTDISILPYSVQIDEQSQLSVIMTTNENNTEDIPFKIKSEIYRIFIKNKYINQPVEITIMSTGTKRIFWLLANVFIASSRKISLIGIEELETSIHPKMLKSLLEFLDEILEDTTIIISSHSPFLVQYIKPEKMYIGHPTDDGTAKFCRVKRNKIKQLISIARDNNMAFGEYIFELLSGDSDNEDLLSFYLEE